MHTLNDSGLTTYFQKYKQFGDPMLLPSSSLLPSDHLSVMDYALFLYTQNRHYANAAERTNSYFIGKLAVSGKQGDSEEREHWLEFLQDNLNVLDFAMLAGMEMACYGNCFATIYFPFDRVLVDLRNGSYKEWSPESFPIDLTSFDAKTMQYIVPDPREHTKSWETRKKVKLPFVDRPSYDVNRMALRVIDPREVILLYSEASGDSQVIRRFNPLLRAKIARSDMFEINRRPRTQLEAIVKSRDYLYDERAVFHMKSRTITGITSGGWALPPTILQFSNFFQMQVYRKADEAIAMDYMLPFRVISPDYSALDSAIIESQFAQYANFTDQMIKTRRSDPFAMHSMPFPIRIQESGANGKAYSPKDLIQVTKDDILEAAGYPIEMWRGTMAFQTMPTALRMFESHFGSIYRNTNALIKWLNQRITEYVNRDKLNVILEPPSLADDLESRAIILSLAQSGEISLERAFKAFNIRNPIEEMRRRTSEDEQREIIKAESQARLEQRLAAGTITGEGQAPGSAVPVVTPEDQMAKAEMYADQALASPPGDSQRLLRFLMSTEPELHALTKEFMSRKRRMAEAEGRAQLQAPQQ